MQAGKFYEIIEHTADIGIRVQGEGLKDLFKNTARAMFEIMAEKPSVAPALPGGKSGQYSAGKKIDIVLKADNLEELFINWLNELLSLSATKETIFEEFKIDKLDKNSIKAQAIGFNIKNYRVNTEIKAATYHALKLEKGQSGWQAEVIFDV